MREIDITIGVSNRHLHITKEDLSILFGMDFELENIKNLNQTNEFASSSFVDVKTDKNILNKVRILGPCRSYTQLEISKTDARFLGINPPVRESGNLLGASMVEIIGPCGIIKKECAIIANRHIHINPEKRKELNLIGIEKVKVKLGEEKKTILDDVFIKESLLGFYELHIDTDDANSSLVNNNDLAKIIVE